MEEQKEKTGLKDTVMDWVISIVAAIAIAMCIRTFIVEPYLVSGPSMLPTLENRERLLVNKFHYFFNDPGRGEIIVFRYPSDTSRDFIKRIIAVGGDTVEIRNGTTFVNGQQLKENYIKEPFHTNYRKTVIPKGHVFVMGDNRNNSEDSRYSDVGFVPHKLVKGKAFVVFWPLDKWKALP